MSNPFIEFPPLPASAPRAPVIVPETGAGARRQPQAETGLAIPVARGAAATPLPLSASFSIVDDVVKMTVLGAYYQNSPTGDHLTISPITTPATGQYAYLKLTMDEGVNLVSPLPQIVVLETKRTSPFTVTTHAGSPSFVYASEAYILLAEVEEIDGSDPVAYRLKQYFNGNVLLTHEVHGGYLTLWPYSVQGSIPPSA